MNEIFIICNSSEALLLISSGYFPNLHSKDLFTCNNAFTFFRTFGKHYNFFCDAEDIKRFFRMPEKLCWDYQKKISFIFSEWDLKRNGFPLWNPDSIISPVCVPASSGMNALFYLNSLPEKYKTIWLIGYTFNEWEGIETNPRLAEKKSFLDKLDSCYERNKPYPFVYRYTLLP